MRRVASALVAVAVLTTACGGDEALSSSGMRVSAARQLQSDVFVLANAAAAKNWTDARTAVAALRADLDASRASGAISVARAQDIEATIATIVRELPAVPTTTRVPTTPKTTSKSTQTPKPAPAPHKKKHGHDG
ncbi:MAG TPA: hypothetical protein VJ831_00725 [Jatrophihabitantaceae bacterium]|nr:hypothetical protein [Jatrophihabitantaceae bacterium]